jgi:hypothetical protein
MPSLASRRVACASPAGHFFVATIRDGIAEASARVAGGQPDRRQRRRPVIAWPFASRDCRRRVAAPVAAAVGANTISPPGLRAAGVELRGPLPASLVASPPDADGSCGGERTSVCAPQVSARYV